MFWASARKDRFERACGGLVSCADYSVNATVMAHEGPVVESQTMSDPVARRLDEAAVVVDTARDDVAVAREAIAAGASLTSDQFGVIRISADVAMGHRFAIRAVSAGAWIKQYGQPFARSRGLRRGDPINADTTESLVPQVDVDTLELAPPLLPPWDGPRPTFKGFRRAAHRDGGRLVTRPISQCGWGHRHSAHARLRLPGYGTSRGWRGGGGTDRRGRGVHAHAGPLH
jgi:hypothetical protein